MAAETTDSFRYPIAIRQSGFSIHEPIEIGDPSLWIPSDRLEALLNTALTGRSLAGLPLRTRSKVVKESICAALGYPIPASFRRTRPRFPGQSFDVYIQKSNNLQVWNEEVDPARRYVIVRVDASDTIAKVKVIVGDVLARLDTTGTLTGKYQARLVLHDSTTELVTASDTDLLRPLAIAAADTGANSPIDSPHEGHLLSLTTIFDRLRQLVGKRFADSGRDQERNRGAALHKLVCEQLGYADYRDSGQFPDVRHQLLEVKLQTSATIDLGVIRPDSTSPLDVARIGGRQIRHCDVRYALFYASTDGNCITLTHFFLTTGEGFFARFPQFQGKVVNRKLQIPLPADFFDA